MLVTVHQPNVLPRAKVLQKLSMSTTWVVLDDVQFNRRDYQHRALVVPAVSSQRAHWLSAPVSSPHGRETAIRDVVPAPHADILKVLSDGLRGSFGSRGELDDLLKVLAASYCPSDMLVSLGIASSLFLLNACELPVPSVIRASELRTTPLPKSQGILQLLNQLGAARYLADSGATAYLDTRKLLKAGVDVVWQSWKSYPMLGMDVDLIRNGAAINVWLRDKRALRALLEEARITTNQLEVAT